jgi:hypothetical protein
MKTQALATRMRCLIVIITGALAIFPCFANVVTDWDTRAVAVALPGAAGQRELAMVHVAIFDAVNSIQQRFRPYRVSKRVPPTTSEVAAACAAAATMLGKLHPEKAADINGALKVELASIAEGSDKAQGVRLGEEVAAEIFEDRATDGSAAADTYRPRTSPGVYVPTAPVLGSAWPKMRPFFLQNLAQFGRRHRLRSRASNGLTTTTRSRNWAARRARNVQRRKPKPRVSG